MLPYLVENRIVKRLLPAKLQDLKGGSNVLGNFQEDKAKDFDQTPDPSFLQIRQAIVENIAIPLGSSYAISHLEAKRHFFLFYGAVGTGKTLAVRALATECNAMVIDISPTNLTRWDKKVSDQKQMLCIFNMAVKVALKNQPAIIYCEDFEMCMQGKGMGKKKKDGDPNLPLYGKMKKCFMDTKKCFKGLPNERIMIICCTNKLQDASIKEIKKYFDRFIYFPCPDYCTRKMLLQHFIDLKSKQHKNVEIPMNFDISVLATRTQGYTAGTFEMIVDRVLTDRRMLRIQEEPLKTSEFLGPIINLGQLQVNRDDYKFLKDKGAEISGQLERYNMRTKDKEGDGGGNPKAGKKGKK